MNISQLKYIIETARCGSINKAAKSLLVSQPWLSACIKDLEEELNFTLFERTSKGVLLTVEGKEFIKNANQLLLQIEKMQSLYNHNTNDHAPSILKISTGRYSFVTKVCIDFYNKYFDRCPNFTIHSDESNCQTVVTNIFNKKSEIGIIHVSDKSDEIWKNKLDEKGIEYNFLFHSASCIVLRKKHPLCGNKDLTIEDLFDFPLFHTTGKNAQLSHYDETPNLYPYEKFNRNVYTNNRNSVFDFISHSNAIYLANSDYAIKELHPNLTTVPYPSNKVSWSFYWIKLKNMKLSQNAINFIKLLEKYTP